MRPDVHQITRRILGIDIRDSKLKTMRDLVEVFTKHHPQDSIDGIVHGYRVARKAHDGQFRHSSFPAIIHPVEVAYEMARRGYGQNSIITMLLHDTVEDCGLRVSDIARLFGSSVALRVDLLTKPRLVNGVWVFANQRAFYDNPDEYVPSTEASKTRSVVYHNRIFDCGILDVIIGKFLDSFHGLRSMTSFPAWKRDAKIDDMLHEVLWLAPRILTQQDYADFLGELRKWGHIFPEDLAPRMPDGCVVLMLPRRVVNRDLLLGIPPPIAGYVSLYWDNHDMFEIGLPNTAETIPLYAIRGLFPGAFVRPERSLVPAKIGAYELVFSVHGFIGDLHDAMIAAEKTLRLCHV